MQFNRKYIIGSLIAHFLILIIATLVSMCSRNLKRTFVVFGAHSRKPTFVSYKSSKAKSSHAVPFVSSGSSRKGKGSGKGSGKYTTHKKAKAHAKIASKRNQKKSSKHAPQSQSKHPAKHAQAQPKIQKAKFHELGAKVKIKNKKDHHKTKKESASKHKQSKKEKPKKQPQKIIKPIEADEEEAKTPPPPPKEPEKPKQEEPKESTPTDDKTIVDNTQAALPDDQNPQQNDPNAADSDDEAEEGEVIDDDTGFNLIGEYDHKDLVMYQKHVQREVDRLWRPPVGVPKGTICTIMFSINDDGSVETFDFVKRSNVLIYDLSVMRIAKNFQFDKCLWGKQFKIDFRQ